MKPSFGGSLWLGEDGAIEQKHKNAHPVAPCIALSLPKANTGYDYIDMWETCC